MKNCELCDTDSPLGFCGKDTCTLYGNCYQKDELKDSQTLAIPSKDPRADVPSCLKTTDMSCVLYDTMDECIGSLGEQDTPSVDVLYK